MERYKEPIPNMTELRAKRTAALYPLRLDAPENNERAVDVRLHGIMGENYYHREDNPPYLHRAPGSIPELYVREGILTRLHKVNELLSALDYELYLFDAYRPVEVQTYFHDHWVPEYLRTKFPEWTEQQIRDEVGNYWAKGAPTTADVDPLAPPPHATGGVVDLTLRNMRSGEQLFMGSAFDEVSQISFADHFEVERAQRTLTMSEELALMNRRILYSVMTEAGFAVNPNEWWHFGYGDKLSASLTNAPHAVYSILKI
jgi:D-alanyl-D-alanine dipeptidase